MMPMSVENVSFILHELQHRAESGMQVITSPAPLAASSAVTDLAHLLHQTFQSKGNRAFAIFAGTGADTDTGAAATGEVEAVPFPALLADYQQGTLDLVHFSNQAAQLLVNSVNKYGMQCEGYLYFSHYQHIGAEYIMIGVFETEESVSFGDSLDIRKVKHIDIQKMGLAVQIDLTSLRTNPEDRKYISFIKGRAGRKVADFFLEFLSASEGVDQKMQNQTLVHALDTYADRQQIGQEPMQQARQSVMGYCREQMKNGEELETRRIAELVPDGTETDFYRFISEEVGLPESIAPDSAALRKLTKFVGSGGGLTISFDEKLLGERIRYDAATDTLVITGTPPNLKDQLLRRQGH